MCVSVSMSVFMCMHVKCMCVYACVCMCVYVFVCVFEYVCICVLVSCFFLYMDLCVYKFISVFIYVVCTYIHANIHNCIYAQSEQYKVFTPDISAIYLSNVIYTYPK